MKRLFWIALGATAGVLVVRKLTQTARSLTPEGAADRVSGALGHLTEAVREFADDVRAGMAEREAELHHSLGLVEPPDAPEPPFPYEQSTELHKPNHRRGTY